MKFDKFTDVCMTGVNAIPPVIQTFVNFSFCNLIFSAIFTGTKGTQGSETEPK